MNDPLHLLLGGATVLLLIQTTRRTMAGSLTLGAVVCLLSAVVILSVRNRSLKSSMEEERNLSLKSLDGMSAELESCKQDVEMKKTSIDDLKTKKQQLEEASNTFKQDIEGLKLELSSRDQLASTVEELHADIASMSERAERQQLDLDAALERLASLTAEKATLEAHLGDTLRKLEVAEAAAAAAAKTAAAPAAAKAAAAPIEPPAAPANLPAAPANQPGQEGAAAVEEQQAPAAVEEQQAAAEVVEQPQQVPEQQ